MCVSDHTLPPHVDRSAPPDPLARGAAGLQQLFRRLRSALMAECPDVVFSPDQMTQRLGADASEVQVIVRALSSASEPEPAGPESGETQDSSDMSEPASPVRLPLASSHCDWVPLAMTLSLHPCPRPSLYVVTFCVHSCGKRWAPIGKRCLCGSEKGTLHHLPLPVVQCRLSKMSAARPTAIF